MPFPECKLTGLYPAEADEQHKKEQYGLCLTANDFKNRSRGVNRRDLHIDKVCSGAGKHAYHKHPVLKEFE